MKHASTVLLVMVVLCAGVVAGYFLASNRPAMVVPTPTPDPMIMVSVPLPGANVASPFQVTGQARGPWYFEASFPVTLKDSSGAVLVQTIAEAQSDWMTTDWVPFVATLTFPPQPAGSTGTLILRKDNPSGDPQYDDSRTIPVVFP